MRADRLAQISAAQLFPFHIQEQGRGAWSRQTSRFAGFGGWFSMGTRK
jgi:hypothetical protein